MLHPAQCSNDGFTHPLCIFILNSYFEITMACMDGDTNVLILGATDHNCLSGWDREFWTSMPGGFTLQSLF